MLEWVEMAIDRAIEAGIEEALQDEATLKEAVEQAGYVMVKMSVRPSDVNPSTKLQIMENLSGDVVLTLYQKDQILGSVEYAMSGCHSRKTREALRKVIPALDADNKAMMNDSVFPPWALPKEVIEYADKLDKANAIAGSKTNIVYGKKENSND